MVRKEAQVEKKNGMLRLQVIDKKRGTGMDLGLLQISLSRILRLEESLYGSRTSKLEKLTLNQIRIQRVIACFAS